MTYSQKLKDPRWQKKRLDILNRDDWTCRKCENKESTLHVHHKVYIKGKDPWEYPAKFLITLCDSCHEDWHRMKNILDLRLAQYDYNDLRRLSVFAIDKETFSDLLITLGQIGDIFFDAGVEAAEQRIEEETESS